MNNFLIRRVTSKDFDELLKMNIKFVEEMSKYYKEHKQRVLEKKSKDFVKKLLMKRLRNKNNIFLVAIKKKEIIGYIYGSMEKGNPVVSKEAEISAVFVKEQFRGGTIGRSLLKNLLEILKKKGVKNFNASVAVRNKRSIALFKIFNFYEHSLIYVRHDV